MLLSLGIDASSPIDDANLIRRSQGGDVSAFNVLVERYQQQIFNHALRMLGDAESAADVTQDTFLAAFQTIKRFRGGSLRAFLLRIATNACYDRLRARQRQPTDSLDARLAGPDPPALPDPGESPEHAAERRELGRVLQRALLALPPDQRAVVLLSDVQGLSYDEIGLAMGLPLGTVKSRLSRARAALRDLLRRDAELLPAAYRLDDERTVP